jgi:hypothetical protein
VASRAYVRDAFFGGDTGVRQSLVFGESADKRQYERDVALGGGNDADRDGRGAHGGSIELAPGTVNDIFIVLARSNARS